MYKHLSTVLSLITLIIVSYVATKLFQSETQHQLLANQIAAQEKVLKQNQERFDYHPKLERINAIAAHLIMRGNTLTKIEKYLRDVEIDIINDMSIASYYAGVDEYTSSILSLEVIDDVTLKLYDQWIIRFDSPDATFRNKFPRHPFLAVDNEIIAFPSCEEPEKPSLYWIKATRYGQRWQKAPVIIEDPENQRWLLKFNEEKSLDVTSNNKRLVVMAGCE